MTETEIVVQEPVVQHPDPTGDKALKDLRTQAMNAPLEVIKQALDTYKERRDYIREWLMGQLKEGVHYGVPPGCEVPTMIVTPDDKQGRRPGRWYKSGKDWHHEAQWRPKPSLYKAGADLVCDLFKVRPQYAADESLWVQGGSKPFNFYMVCRLYNENGDIVGEGRGASKIGTRQDENAAVKKAQKCAKVDAVLNTYGLSDLFTQDLEDGAGQPPLHDNPPQAPDAPREKTRDERLTRDMFNAMFNEWLAGQSSDDKATLQANWRRFCLEATGENLKQFDPARFDSWTRGRYDVVYRAIGLPTEEDLRG